MVRQRPHCRARPRWRRRTTGGTDRVEPHAWMGLVRSRASWRTWSVVRASAEAVRADSFAVSGSPSAVCFAEQEREQHEPASACDW